MYAYVYVHVHVHVYVHLYEYVYVYVYVSVHVYVYVYVEICICVCACVCICTCICICICIYRRHRGATKVFQKTPENFQGALEDKSLELFRCRPLPLCAFWVPMGATFGALWVTAGRSV